MSADSLMVEEQHIREIRSLMTIVGGRSVYESPDGTPRQGVFKESGTGRKRPPMAGLRSAADRSSRSFWFPQ